MSAPRLGTLVIGAAGCAIAMAAGTAPGPTFDCRQAAGQVEQLICHDAALAARDRQMRSAYAAAAARARGRQAALLRAEQRGWVKGRNDCWKADGRTTWITASWTVEGVAACVDAQYRLRTAELQAVWQLLPPRSVTYACQGNPANQVVARFFATDPATIRLERGDRTLTLWNVGPPEDGHFEGRNVDLVHQDKAVTLGGPGMNAGLCVQSN